MSCASPTPVSFLGEVPALIAAGAGPRTVAAALRQAGREMIASVLGCMEMFQVAPEEWNVWVAQRRIDGNVIAYDLRIAHASERRRSYLGVSFMADHRIVGLTYTAHFAGTTLDMLQTLDEKMAAFVDESRHIARDILVDGKIIADERTKMESAWALLEIEESANDVAIELAAMQDAGDAVKAMQEFKTRALPRLAQAEDDLINIADAVESAAFVHDHEIAAEAPFYTMSGTQIPFPLGCFAGLYLAATYLRCQMRDCNLDSECDDDLFRDWRSIARIWDRVRASEVIPSASPTQNDTKKRRRTP